jgi:superfamily I DNA/RNA helicase
MITYTPEQHDVLDHLMNPENTGITLVSAGAGTGKSWLSRRVVEELKPKRCLYTAFNKAIVQEGESRFRGTSTECKTLHALAYSYVRPKGSISDISYGCIEEDISYNLKYMIITGINRFFVSDSVNAYEFMEEHFEGEDHEKMLAELSVKYIEKMANKELDPTFNFLLKYFHLMLHEGTVTCKYDLVILDEINDTTAVALEIFKLIDAPKKLGLGETHQAIYDFLHLVNGFELLKDADLFHLTQSFRCSEEIAGRIEKFMKLDADDTFKFVGTDEPVRNGKTLVCTSTNASIVAHIQDCLDRKKGFQLLRKISEIFACPLAVTSASAGKAVYQKKFKHLEDEYKNWNNNRRRGYSYFQHLLDHFDDQETVNAVQLLLNFQRKGINIFSLYKKAKESNVDLNYTIATVFTSKGLEFETVLISDDLNTRIAKIRENGGVRNHDDLVAYRCYYVAASRAGVNLLNATALY